MATIKTNKQEILHLTKGESKRWYSPNAYGLSRRVIWYDENCGMWVKMGGKFLEVIYRTYGFYGDITDSGAVMEKYNSRFAYEI